MIKALVFDFDGTVIDTETAWYHAFREAYAKYGVDLSLDLYSGCIGTDLNSFNPYEYLVTTLRLPIDLNDFRESVQTRHRQLMDAEEMRSGVLEYLTLAKSKGLKLGMASSSEFKWVERFITKLGIRDYFQCIRTANDVQEVKPNPELYLQTLDCLGVRGDEAIAIEDSPNGAQAAVAAGLHCVVVPNSITRKLQFGGSYRRANSLAEIDFDKLLGTLVG